MIFNRDKHFAPISNAKAAQEALEDIQLERSMEKGLISRWPALNRGVMKHFRFNTIYTIAGASGSAKSFILNMLRTDFTDQQEIRLNMDHLSDDLIQHFITKGEFVESLNDLVRYPLNGHVPFKPVFLHFSIEMHPKKENIRALSSFTGFSYDYLHSSAKIGTDEKGFNVYNKITDHEMNCFSDILEQFGDRKNILPFKLSPNIDEFKAACYTAAEKYPNNPIIIGLDHALLMSRKDEKGDRELQDAFIKAAIEVRDSIDAMIFIVAQMNSDIEDEKRRSNHNLHYPTKKDIYMGGQLYQGSDVVFTAFSPARIFITHYGPDKIPTDKLIHLGLIKNRNGIEGNIWLKNRLDIGKVVPVSRTKNTDGSVNLIEQSTLVNQIF